MQNYDYKRGLPAIFMCYFLWGFQPLYWHLCSDIDTFFLLASRIIWASVFCYAIINIQGKTGQFKEVFRNRKLLVREAAAMLMLFGDWAVYLWAVQNGRVMECSLGYYIQPLVVFAFGALIFHEPLTWKHIVILSIVAVGIVLSARGFNGIPWVTVLLAVMFAIYAAIKKGLGLDPVVSTGCEIMLMIPFSLLIIALFYTGENGLGGLDIRKTVLLILSGAVTAVPMLLYSISIRKLPLMTNAICQYLSPTISIFCSLIMGETLTKEKLVSFIFVWIGVILYTANEIRTFRK